jgi:hypothetical protein
MPPTRSRWRRLPLQPKEAIMATTIRSRAGVLALVTLFLVLVVTVAAASGESAGEQPSLATGLEGLEGSNGSVVQNSTNPAAASDVALDEMGREQAGDLLQTVFEPVLDAAGGTFDELEIQKFLAPDVAVAVNEDAEGNRQRVLVDSTIPLQAENHAGDVEAIDLSLDSVAGVIEAANPLVDVEFPAELRSGINLPDAGIGIRLDTDADSRQAAVLDGQTAFYPEVAVDTDFAITPTPLGFETLTQIRSSDAPMTQRLSLRLPDGANLSSTGAGGATVLQDGDLLMSIDAPSAVDAGGEEVPVTMDVAGNDLLLTANPGPDAEYPILVDPLFQTYEWASEVFNWQTEDGPHPNGIHNDVEGEPRWYTIWNTQQAEEWSPEYATGSDPLRFTLALDFGGTYSQPLGLYASTAGGSGTVTAGSHVAWKYVVPRFYADQKDYGAVPQTYISKMKLWNLAHKAYGQIPSPYMELGLMRPNGTWASNLTHTSLSGHHLTDLNYKYEFNGDAESKLGSVGLWALESYSPSQVGATVFVQSAQIELSEPAGNIPKFGTPLAGPTAWLNSSPKPIEFVASDDGLGVYAITATPDLLGSPPSWKTAYGCTGVGTNVCPRSWASSKTGAPALKYDPSAIPAGIGYLKLVAEDPLGQKSSVVKVPVKVDHAAPQLGLSGNLTEQASVGTNLHEYTLNYSASDGDDAAAAAQSPLGSQGTGQGQLESPRGVAVDASGNVWVADTINNRVVEYDKSGAFIRQIGGLEPGSAAGQFNAPRGITVAPNGNVWVADYGNKRLQAFSATGTFIRQVTLSSTEKLEGPYALAVAKDGSIWVSDIVSHRIRHFSESGEFLGNAPDSTLASVQGLAIDSFGHIWATEWESNKVYEFYSNGVFKFSFGGEGTGNGQFKNISGITTAPSGNIFVVDAGNNRIQEFKPDGSYLRQFGTAVTEPSNPPTSQLKEARGVAAGPGNVLYIGDSGNHRVARWTHADQDPQSGVTKLEVKVDGTIVKSTAPGCSTKNCAISGSWVLNANNYSAGTHKIDVIATDGVGLTTTKTLNVETHGDLVAPSIALWGPMTEQATLGTTRTVYKLKFNATDTGSEAEWKSGVVATTIKVDGNIVDSYSAACATEGCSVIREWTMQSSEYLGSHIVRVTATDGAGRVTTKEVPITITKDVTPPKISTGSEAFFTQPQNWLIQKSYGYTTSATDENASGVANFQFKIDGVVVKQAYGTCPGGSCAKTLTGELNILNYAGGSHAAELVATDIAGNVAKRTWTINVDPGGSIPAGEAVATLEAFDDTSESTLIAPNSEIIDPGEQAAGNDPVLQSGIGSLNSAGTPNLSTIATNINGGFEVGVPDSTIEVKPATTATGASAATLVDGSSAVASNTAPNVDTVIRPVFDGIMAFQSIRDQAATEYFSWEVVLREGQTLHQVDEASAQIRYQDGTPAMTIVAEPAHDAVGTPVPTSLTVTEGKLLSLRVQHKSRSFVYPVTGGTGWKGGISTETVAAPMDQKEQEEARWKREEEERLREEEAKAEEEKRREEMRAGVDVPEYSRGYAGPPVLLPYTNKDDSGASASASLPHYGHFYYYDQCAYDGPGGCKQYKLTLKTWIEYNGRYVWWKQDGIHPSCFKSTFGWSADLTFCNWVGNNHQPNYGGYHITSRGVWDIAPLGGPVEAEEPVSVYAYPSGYANGHNTFCVCNPSVP